MRTTTSTTAAVLVGAALLATTACAPGRPASADPLAGQDPATVLRRAYEETQRADFKQALVHVTVGERQIQAYLTVGSDGSCSGSVTTIRAGAAEMYLYDGFLLLKGDTGFVEDHFKDRPADAAERAVARAADRWVTLPADEPSTTRLIGLCTAGGAPAKAYSLDRTDIRREPDTWSDGRPVAVFTSTDANGARITDQVLLTGTAPSLLRRHQQTGKVHDSVLYTVLPDEPQREFPAAPDASAQV